MISILLFLASVGVLFTYGLKPSIDFTGGSLLELSFQGARPTVAEMETVLQPLNLGTTVVQPAGEKDVLLRFRTVSENEHQKILQVVRAAKEKGDEKVLENRFETIGPSISATLRTRAVWSAIAVLGSILIYIAYTFRKISRPISAWKYGVAAILALFHDVAIVAGVFAILGEYKNVEVDIPFVVAILTIFGGSVYDTIVVFDRIRENLVRRGTSNFGETVNNAVNETLARSLNTTFTTLLPLSALFFFGGSTIHYFALALLIGITAGAYSSIFVASPILILWEKWDRRAKA